MAADEEDDADGEKGEGGEVVGVVEARSVDEAVEGHVVPEERKEEEKAPPGGDAEVEEVEERGHGKQESGEKANVE